MRTTSSIFLLIILIPATLIIFIVSSLHLNLLTAHFFKQELANRRVYAIIEDQASQQIAQLKLGDLPVGTADLQALAKRVLPASWLQQNVEKTLDRVFAWFNGPAGTTLSLPIDLRGPKAELIPGIDALIQAAIPRLPACPKKYLPTDLCRVSSMTVDQVKSILKNNGIDLATVTTQLPDSIDLANPVLPNIKLGQDNSLLLAQSNQPGEPKVLGTSTMGQDQQKIDEQKKQDEQNTPLTQETIQEQIKKAIDQLTNVKAQYHRGLQIWLDALIAYAVLILGCLAINIKGWRRLTRWLGILTLTIGILPLAVSIASAVLENKILSLIHISGDLPADIQSAIPAIIQDIQHAVFWPILLVSASLVVLGIAAIIGACFIPGRKILGSPNPS